MSDPRQITPDGKPGRVPVEDLRRELEASGLTARDLAIRLGWYRGNERRTGGERRWVDTGRVTRVLGMRPNDRGHGYGQARQRFVNPRMAVAIRTALHAEGPAVAADTVIRASLPTGALGAEVDEAVVALRKRGEVTHSGTSNAAQDPVAERGRNA